MKLFFLILNFMITCVLSYFGYKLTIDALTSSGLASLGLVVIVPALIVLLIANAIFIVKGIMRTICLISNENSYWKLFYIFAFSLYLCLISFYVYLCISFISIF